jgi:flagellar hook-length control protein FliK
MELQLNPENLGKVNLSIQSKNGVLTAQFVVQNEISKEAIESQMHILRESLNEQGIKVEAIEVTVSNYTFDQTNQENGQNQASSQKNNSGKTITLEEALNMVDNPEEVIDTDDVTDIIGSQVDYTA